jgi:hypothetical protein
MLRQSRQRWRVSGAGIGGHCLDGLLDLVFGHVPGEVVFDFVDSCPADAEIGSVAVALAAILDNPKHVPTQPAAARQLVAILDQMSSGRTAAAGLLSCGRCRVKTPLRPAHEQLGRFNEGTQGLA